MVIGMMRSGKGIATVGPYTQDINNVIRTESIPVPVTGCPDAGLYFFEIEGNTRNLPVIMFIHGGGWSAGYALDLEPYLYLLASRGFIVASLEYSWAPEYPHPASTLQAAEALNWISEHAEEFHADRRNMFVMGNSAGAHITSMIGTSLTNPDFAEDLGVTYRFPQKNVRGVILFNGLYNLETVDQTRFPGIKQLLRSYFDTPLYHLSPSLKQASTILYITPQFPATYITAGDMDRLRNQSKELAWELQNMGVDVTSHFWRFGSGLRHDYMFKLGRDESQVILNEVCTFIYRHCQ